MQRRDARVSVLEVIGRVCWHAATVPVRVSVRVSAPVPTRTCMRETERARVCQASRPQRVTTRAVAAQRERERERVVPATPYYSHAKRQWLAHGRATC